MKKQQATAMGKDEEPAVGIPYAYPAKPMETVMVPPYSVGMGMNNPYQAGMIPSNAIFGHPNGIPLRETVFKDTPAPFDCPNCAHSGLTTIRSKPSVAACVACMMPFMLGICFLCPAMDCLWHKEHYCPNCGQKVADFEKSDPCAVVDVPHWIQESFAVPA